MKSSSGQHFEGLDHLRALAAFLVVLWHFAHPFQNGPVPLGAAPELAIFDESHSGVALFMTLSGYLFAKLIGDRSVDFPAFLWNRALRLLPLLVLALALGTVLQIPGERAGYAWNIVQGLVLPTMPQGGWSIVVELHFYLLLPLLLWGSARWHWLPVAIVGAALTLRLGLASAGFDVKTLAYYTLIGRIDQFALGILAFRCPPSGRLAAVMFGGLWAFYSWFGLAGGFYGEPGAVAWAVLPTVEAVGFAGLVSWYDRHPLRGRWLWPVRKAGDYSYAIYLLHFLMVASVSTFVDRHVVALTNIYIAIPFATLFFAYVAMLGWISHRFLEGPLMQFRKPYIVEDRALVVAAIEAEEPAALGPAAAKA